MTGKRDRPRISDFRRENDTRKPPDVVGPVFDAFRPPRLCSTCGMIHSPEVPCP